ncbi:MAG TPA: hypothetical protein VGW80_11315 [Solirubrobacterales bacterium]|jgi:hypothetical protein|nr:hypothetical protein [Solirubrobacterales bacterium]
MKRLILAGLALVALWLPSSAAAYVEHPGIGEEAAFIQTQHFMAKTYPGWRSRAVGYIDCRNGRINGYSWSCAVGWARGRNCWQGRVRVTAQYAEEGTIYYNVHLKARPC